MTLEERAEKYTSHISSIVGQSYSLALKEIKQAYIAGTKEYNKELTELYEKVREDRDMWASKVKGKWHFVKDELPPSGIWVLLKFKNDFYGDKYAVTMTDAIGNEVFLTGYGTDETTGFEIVECWQEIVPPTER